MGEVYGITGFFEQLRNISPFGGFFLLHPNGRLEGNLVDGYGGSNIGGNLTETDLRFGKIYHERGGIIEYSFKRNPSGIWVGEYDGRDTGRGKAVCKLALNWKDVELDTTPRTIERSVEDLIDSMIEQGMLVPVKEPKRN